MNKNDFEERNLQQLYTLKPAIKYYTYQSFEENYWIYKYGNNFDWNNFDWLIAIQISTRLWKIYICNTY